MKKNKKSKTHLKTASIIFISFFIITAAFLVAYRWGMLHELIDRTDNYGTEEKAAEVTEQRYIIQKINTACGHNKIEAESKLPEELFAGNIPEGAGGSGEIPELPENWYVTNVNETNVLTMLNELCDECINKFYLGNYEGEISVFRGMPPYGVFFKGLEIEVKEVHEEILNKGVPYSSPEEMRQLLESFTS